MCDTCAFERPHTQLVTYNIGAMCSRLPYNHGSAWLCFFIRMHGSSVAYSLAHQCLLVGERSQNIDSCVLYFGAYDCSFTFIDHAVAQERSCITPHDCEWNIIVSICLSCCTNILLCAPRIYFTFFVTTGDKFAVVYHDDVP